MMKKMKMMFGICCAILFMAVGLLNAQNQWPPPGEQPPGHDCWDQSNLANWGGWDYDDWQDCRGDYIWSHPRCWMGCDNTNVE